MFVIEMAGNDKKLEMLAALPVEINDQHQAAKPSTTSLQHSCGDNNGESSAAIPFWEDEDVQSSQLFEAEREFGNEMLMADESVYETSSDSE